MDDLWDEESGRLADMLGNARLINEAVPVGTLPRSLYARSGESWTLLAIQNRGAAEILTLVSGIAAEVPETQELYKDLNGRSLKMPGAYHMVLPYGRQAGGVVFKALLPYLLITEPHGAMTTYAQQLISAALVLPGEVKDEILSAHGGVSFAFEHRGYLTQIY